MSSKVTAAVSRVDRDRLAISLRLESDGVIGDAVEVIRPGDDLWGRSYEEWEVYLSSKTIVL